MYVDNDEMGVTEYKEDLEYIFDAHKVLVQHIDKNQTAQDDYLQGDFLGIRTKTFKDKKQFKYIAVTSNTRGKKQDEQSGVTPIGEEVFTCISKVDSKIKHNDEIIMNNHRYLVKTDSDAEFLFNKAFVKFELRRHSNETLNT